MSLEPELAELLIHEITLERCSGRDTFGVAAFETGVTYPARVEKTHRHIRTGEGREFLTTTTVYVGPTSTGLPLLMTQRDRITLPGGSNAPILHFEIEPDETGDHHMVIYCG